MAANRVVPAPGHESVWDYPRPPRAERTGRHIEVRFNGVVLASTRAAIRVLETSHPPTYYLPRKGVRADCMREAGGSSWCEWKGAARYYDVVVGDRRAPRAAWSYPAPTASFAMIAGCFAFYAQLLDECLVDGERVVPQPGGFYGGWITSDVVGPFKGEPGSQGW
jgi:uncharacterized protein (DUF427 family)